MFLANYLIGLREGLEAALVVSILVAYLVKSGHRASLRWVWVGVGAAVLLSASVATVLQITSNELPDRAEEVFAGLTSVLAVCFVTWMVFWMRRAARSIKGELEGGLDKALGLGVGAIIGVSFLAVAREGLETAVFVWSSVSNATSATVGFVGAITGLTTAAVLGYLLYRGAVRINLGSFFKVTGALLIVVAAGVLAYGVHDLQEAGVLPGEDNIAYDVSQVIDPSGVVGTILRGVFNFSPNPSWLQVVVWFGYLVPTMYLFLRPASAARPRAVSRQEPVAPA
jgi:high-affinity iron transporter